MKVLLTVINKDWFNRVLDAINTSHPGLEPSDIIERSTILVSLYFHWLGEDEMEEEDIEGLPAWVLTPETHTVIVDVVQEDPLVVTWGGKNVFVNNCNDILECEEIKEPTGVQPE